MINFLFATLELETFYTEHVCPGSEVFAGFPFFTSYDLEEINIAAGKIHEVSLDVNAANSQIAWDIHLVSDKARFYSDKTSEVLMILELLSLEHYYDL
ncbi:hypothetical protein M5689_014208 [Euphorbia peplus]|nr:hypothetical protein M5689_014208 [Euphorbia peplus]